MGTAQAGHGRHCGGRILRASGDRASCAPSRGAACSGNRSGDRSNARRDTGHRRAPAPARRAGSSRAGSAGASPSAHVAGHANTGSTACPRPRPDRAAGGAGDRARPLIDGQPASRRGAASPGRGQPSVGGDRAAAPAARGPSPQPEGPGNAPSGPGSRRAGQEGARGRGVRAGGQPGGEGAHARGRPKHPPLTGRRASDFLHLASETSVVTLTSRRAWTGSGRLQSPGAQPHGNDAGCLGESTAGMSGTPFASGRPTD